MLCLIFLAVMVFFFSGYFLYIICHIYRLFFKLLIFCNQEEETNIRIF